MAENSKIEWCDHTFNPWIGCTKVSPACDNCYAESWDKRYGGAHWGAKAPRRRTTEQYWKNPLKWDKEAERLGIRYRVFCASLADIFDNKVPKEWRADLWKLIKETPHLDWLLLTKRPQNIEEMLPEDWGKGYPNVWLGVTAENQKEAERRVLELIAIPCVIRFVSVEPMMEFVDLTRLEHSHAYGDDEYNVLAGQHTAMNGNQPSQHHCNKVHWVICGGESGPNARPMHLDWAISLRDQCLENGTAFLFKQWGEWTPGVNVDRQKGVVKSASWFNEEWSYSTEDLSRDDGHIDDEPDLYRVGKKEAGRILDGETWDQFPVVWAA